MSSCHFSITPIAGYIDGRHTEKIKEPQRYKIIWIKQGYGFYRIDLDRLPVSTNTIHFLLPGIPCYFEPGAEVTGYVIQFDMAFLYLPEVNFTDQFITCNIPAGHPGNVAGHTEEVMKLEIIMEMLLTEYTNYVLPKHRVLSGWLTILLVYITDLLPDNDTNTGYSPSSQVIARFYALLEKNFQVKKAVTDYADALHVAPEHLTSIIKKVTGHPTSHHIKQRVLLEAKRLALYSNESMKEIAYRLGFDEPAHFSKFFKVNCGKSFRDFKRAHTGSFNKLKQQSEQPFYQLTQS